MGRRGRMRGVLYVLAARPGLASSEARAMQRRRETVMGPPRQ